MYQIKHVLGFLWNTGLFISPSGITDLCGTVAGMVTPKGSMSTEGETLPSLCPTLQVLDMWTLGDATDVKFWQIPRHRPLTYSLSTPCFVTTALPSGETCKYATTPSTKKTWIDSLSIDMILSAVSVLVVAQSSSEIPEGLMNNPVYNLLLYTSVKFYPYFRPKGQRFNDNKS
jgi:hypothetical protein